MPVSSRSCGLFAEDIFGDTLEAVVDWIENNLRPDEVFTMPALTETIRFANDPDDVFTDAELSDWAKDNGFVKETP